MDDTTAYRLNELFNRWASDKKLTRSELMMTFTTQTGSKVSVHPSTPYEAASYLRRFIKRDDPLFMPGDIRCDSLTQSKSRAGSILFKGFGYVRDRAGLEHHKTMLHMKFTGMPNSDDQIGDMESRGYVSFNEDFGDDPQEPLHVQTGPTVHEFIRALETAGSSWSNMNFSNRNTRMNAGSAPMQLINTKK